MKKLGAILLSFLLFIGVFPTSSFAATSTFDADFNKYLKKIPSDPKKLQEYVQQLKDSDSKLRSKIETMEKRINSSRKTVRQLRHDEVAIFLVSTDLGHFRKDIVTSFYTTFSEVQKYYDEVKKAP